MSRAPPLLTRTGESGVIGSADARHGSSRPVSLTPPCPHPASCCRRCTTSYAGWPLHGWHERPGHTLQATALVHEAWIRLATRRSSGKIAITSSASRPRPCGESWWTRPGPGAPPSAAATECGSQGIDIDAPLPESELLALNEALDKLTVTKPDHARLIELRYFAGLTGDEAAAAMGVSPATADRMWRYARAWLRLEMGDNSSG